MKDSIMAGAGKMFKRITGGAHTRGGLNPGRIFWSKISMRSYRIMLIPDDGHVKQGGNQRTALPGSALKPDFRGSACTTHYYR